MLRSFGRKVKGSLVVTKDILVTGVVVVGIVLGTGSGVSLALHLHIRFLNNLRFVGSIYLLLRGLLLHLLSCLGGCASL